ncbi:DUF58 domain-containing protein [Bifidobacterium sp. SMB2]|uniref:DUF58 domain-containing protein n=1 Tax=Bifidobacterium saimiriisciurei TaxID=2661627 RepID=A0ABX0C9W6_9BIFI|nr:MULTISPECIES: DUF58 domain-containing protein [Bifidobacterium]NEG95608.1 DUF58 domain-containing protein [Bifidobacterium sp. SMB2]NEH11921.1 DUF58 domain-containing protein [Bifidobacterium saimiriisciurei]
MIAPPRSGDPIRRKIESLGTRLSLPTVIKALGVLEGEHPAARRGTGYDYLDIRPYEPGEEARLIDWKASARAGRPMIIDKERESNGNVWLLLDVGREMTGACPSGERAIDVAANALRMFAMLSLRRSDDLSIVLGDDSHITRVPFNGGFAKFEHVFDGLLDRDFVRPRNFDALIDYAGRIRNRRSLVVLATDEAVWTGERARRLRTLAQTHPIITVNVSTINPFAFTDRFDHVVDARDGRRVPAFMRTRKVASSVDVHREFQAAAAAREVVKNGSTMIRGASSDAMFDEFVSLVSTTLARGGFRQAPPAGAGDVTAMDTSGGLS